VAQLSSLDAATLAKLAGVKLRARAVMDGVLSGLHKSPHQGQSVEFSEHKEYAPGDELRHLDWKAFGKFDRYYVKRYEHETNLKATLVVDASGSMGYRSGPLSKLEVATTLAGTLAYLLVRQQDAVGVSVVTRAGAADVPPRAAAGHLHTVLDALDSLQPAGGTDLFAAADHLAERVRRGQLVVGPLRPVRRPGRGPGPHPGAPGTAQRPGPVPRARPRRAGVSLRRPDPLPLARGRAADRGERPGDPRELPGGVPRLPRPHPGRLHRRGRDYMLVRTDEPLDAVLLRFLGRRQRRAA
jgi:uncharacterized protein (DUF58 family)